MMVCFYFSSLKVWGDGACGAIDLVLEVPHRSITIDLMRNYYVK